jgi:hypothetical protein
MDLIKKDIDMTLRTPLSSVLALSAGLALAAAQAADPHAGHTMPAPAPAGQTLKATLTGATEVPGPGDADGSGTATVTIDTVKGQLCYTVNVTLVDGVTMAHIHRAPMGSMGNVVYPFAAPTTGSSQGCAAIKPDLAAAILASPSDFYVNVHSQANPAGAVRGQLGK